MIPEQSNIQNIIPKNYDKSISLYSIWVSNVSHTFLSARRASRKDKGEGERGRGGRRAHGHDSKETIKEEVNYVNVM